MRTLMFGWMMAAALAQDPAAEPAAAEPAAMELPTEPAALRAAIRAQLTDVPPEMMDRVVEQLAANVELDRKLSYQTGAVVLGDGLATVQVGDGWRLLDGAAASDVLVAWGNPRPPVPPLAMLVPGGMSPMEDAAWAVLVDYEEDGHVDDSDAASMDYTALLKEMQESTREEAKLRVEAGLQPLELVGWAEPPHYDAAERKLYWAKQLRSPDGESLNFDVRVLGRKGVLALSAVSSMEQLEEVRVGMQGLLPQVSFNDGNRYADFDPDIDAVAAAGIGALIAGKVAAKTGLFKGFLALLFAGKKVIAAGVVGLAALASRLFGKKDEAA